MNDTTTYRLLKFCNNCRELSKKEDTRCTGCGMLFVEEKQEISMTETKRIIKNERRNYE